MVIYKSPKEDKQILFMRCYVWQQQKLQSYSFIILINENYFQFVVIITKLKYNKNKYYR